MTDPRVKADSRKQARTHRSGAKYNDAEIEEVRRIAKLSGLKGPGVLERMAVLMYCARVRVVGKIYDDEIKKMIEKLDE